MPNVTLTSYVLSPWDGSHHGGGSNLIALSYADLDFTPSAADSYKSTSGDVFKVYVGGIRIYRRSDQTYASGSGFLEDGDASSGATLNGKTGSVNNNTVSWDSTTDAVWTIDTANRLILISKSAVAATDLYGNGTNALNIAFSSGSTIITLTRAVQDLKTPAIDFSNASILTEQDLDNSAKNVFHASQQAIISTENALLYSEGTDTYSATQPGTSNAKRISNVATPTSANDAANKAYVDGGSDVQTVAGLSTEIGLLGTSAMATATTGHIPVLANVVEQTVNYTVTVASSKFNIQGGVYGSATENPALTLIRGYTYVFDVSDSSVATHPLVFMNGSSTLGTSDGVTTTGTAGQAGAKVTVVVSDSVTITKYSCSAHGDTYGNTITLRHDDFKEVADNNTNVTTVAGQISPTNNIATVAGANTNIGLVAGQISPTNNINTVANLNTEITEVAGKSTEIDVLVNKYDGSTTATSGTNKNITQVDTVADSIAKVNSVADNISQVTTFADTYHTAGTTEPSGSNVDEGDLWFDTANDVLKVYDGNSWASASSSIATVASQNEFTASDGQGTDNKYFAVAHDVGLELVFLNGVRLKRGNDYYCTNSNTSTTPIASGNDATFVRLETVPSTNDILSVMAFGQIANNLAVNTAGGTFTGNITVPNATASGHAVNKSQLDAVDALPAQTSHSGKFLTTDGSSASWGSVTPTTVSDQANTSTGYFDVPSGTTAQRPGSPNAGNLRFNSDTGSLEVYSGTGWIATNEPAPTITSISGGIYAGISGRSLTITGTDFNTGNISIEWLDGNTQIVKEDNITPTSSTSVTRTIPASVYGKASGTTIGIRILNAGEVASNIDTSKSVTSVPSGGTTSTSGNYYIHSFTTTGSSNFVNPIANLSIEYLVIAGGGAGGSAGAGGGAGGYRTNVSGQTSGANSSTEPALTLPVATYTITVGAGGAISGGNTGGQGNPSSISHSGITDITTVGGGGGGNFNSSPYSPTNGGSAGGQAATNGSAATPTANQGMAGAAGTGGGGNTSGGGGGGAGEAGQAGTASTAGRGGNGLSNNITGTAVTRAGGGAGGGDARSSNGGVDGNIGGTGGGGQSYKTANGGVGQAGTDGTGSGGGGGTIASGGSHAVNGGDGGDGIVIIRYQLP